MGERFAKDERGATVERFAVAAALIGFVAWFCGASVAQLASAGRLPTIAFLSSEEYVATRKPDRLDAIDYTATGSIRGRVVLDPCTGRQKSD